MDTAQAYQACEEITWSQARNFAYGIRLLPAGKRQSLAALYAFARRIDDIGDGDMAAPDKPIDWSAPVPQFDDFHRRMWDGEIDLKDKEVKISHGRIHWERLIQKVQQPRYREALRIVSDGPGARGLPEGRARDR